jgi:hypothetical protein
MEPPFLRLLIQEKLADGRLPSAPLPRAWDRPGTGQTCDGCSETVTPAQTVVEHLDGPGRGVRFHVECFHVWNVARQMAEHEPGARLPARSAFRAVGARPSRPWAPHTPAARPTRPASP